MKYQIYISPVKPEGHDPGMFFAAFAHVSYERRWQTDKDEGIIPLLMEWKLDMF